MARSSNTSRGRSSLPWLLIILGISALLLVVAAARPASEGRDDAAAVAGADLQANATAPDAAGPEVVTANLLPNLPEASSSGPSAQQSAQDAAARRIADFTARAAVEEAAVASGAVLPGQYLVIFKTGTRRIAAATNRCV